MDPNRQPTIPMHSFRKTAPALLLAFCLLSVLPVSAAVEYQYTILERESHDPEVFTQGFLLHEGWFYESSGHYGRSFLLRYPLDGESGSRPKRIALPRDVFGEGIAMAGDRLFLLSWKAGKAWALDKDSLQVLREFRYGGEGWGLTHNGDRFILSDGSDLLRFYDEDFQLVDTLKVRLDGKAVKRLNELEYHDGLIWANQWMANTIYAIDAESGDVEATVDLSALQRRSAARSGESVLNGIAYDKERDAFWITGKYWRHRYLLRFSEPTAKQADR